MTLLIAQLKGIVAVARLHAGGLVHLLVRDQGRRSACASARKRKKKAWTSASTARSPTHRLRASNVDVRSDVGAGSPAGRDACGRDIFAASVVSETPACRRSTGIGADARVLTQDRRRRPSPDRAPAFGRSPSSWRRSVHDGACVRLGGRSDPSDARATSPSRPASRRHDCPASWFVAGCAAGRRSALLLVGRHDAASGLAARRRSPGDHPRPLRLRLVHVPDPQERAHLRDAAGHRRDVRRAADLGVARGDRGARLVAVDAARTCCRSTGWTT